MKDLKQILNRSINIRNSYIIGMILFPTIYKVVVRHNDNLIKVVEEEFLYQARNCYNEDKCLDKKVYLKELYEKGYLKDKLTNPINKKYYSEESFVDLDKEKVSLK